MIHESFTSTLICVLWTALLLLVFRFLVITQIEDIVLRLLDLMKALKKEQEGRP